MNFHIVVFSRKLEKYLEEAAGEYRKRLSRYAKVRVSRLRPETPAEKALDPKGMNVWLEAGMPMVSSEELAERIRQAEVGGVSRVTVLLGKGLPAEVWDALPEKENVLRMGLTSLRLSPGMELTAALEQIYRAYKIIHGETYHK